MTRRNKRCPAPWSSKSFSPTEFSGGFDSDQIDALTQRGILEAHLMQASGAVGVLGEANKKKKKTKTKENNKKKKGPSTATAARTLSQDGVVRLNGILSASTAATLREKILDRRADAFAAISSSGEDNNKEDWRKYFADVLLKNNRCDLLLPLKGNRVLQTALHEILVASNLLSSILQIAIGGGDDATLYELSALISEPGSPRQPVHPDNPHQEHPPLFTVFIALQDITSPMGPTIFLPKTNTAEAHAEYNDIPHRDAFLESSPSVAALLNAGDASLFDSRTMHCGGANDEVEGATRCLLYLSFRNPSATEPIGNVGSIMPDIPKMTVRELRTKLAAALQDDSSDPFDDEREKEDAMNAIRLAAAKGDALAQLNLGIIYYVGENGVETNHAEAARWFELAAAQGLAHAQFNLGCCHSMGIGVPRQDLECAMELFQLAADQDHPGAKEAFDEAQEKMQTL
mmetsp:Transcript_1252/g.2304  ORF Transcript_1252/g.2304 Transcript_1252/m.2304 type:complete len:459 (+) Transcript_1252:254-1630(+)